MEVLKSNSIFWMPKWCGLMIDPSAREIRNFIIKNIVYFLYLYIQLKVIIKYKY